MPFWLLKGRSVLKDEIARRTTIDPRHLPYRDDVVSFVQEQRAGGRTVILATAASNRLAEPVAEHLDCFDEVLASTAEVNLKGRRKCEALVEKYGEGEFDYIGDSLADIPIWRNAGSCLVVRNGQLLQPSLPSDLTIEKEFQLNTKPLVILRALRVYQWVKNLLLFVPVIMAHRVEEVDLVFQAIIAFFAFSCCSSSVYLINDLSDLESDRQHATKCRRPIASGEMSIPLAVALAVLLPLVSIFLCLALPIEFAVVLAGYYAVTFGYSFSFKKVAVLDIVVLASLYTIRVIAGGASVAVPVSPWLLGFSMFLFFSLACVKRYSELLALQKSDKDLIAGRGYRASDMQPISSFGAASGYISVLVMALYLNSAEVERLYGTVWVLWLICPMLLFWITRVWLLTHRDELHEDPIVFAIKDKVSYLVGLLCFIVVLIAR
jgi:4-hydroxybenzoate polyprenyltransferase